MRIYQNRLFMCFSISGVKFIVVTTAGATVPVESLLNKLYELYADYALKNPFYTNDMPIRLVLYCSIPNVLDVKNFMKAFKLF